MEVPDSVVRNVPDEYEVTSQKKGSRRYRTPHINRLLSELTDAEERRDAAQRDTMRRIFFQFDRQYVAMHRPACVLLSCFSDADHVLVREQASRI